MLRALRILHFVVFLAASWWAMVSARLNFRPLNATQALCASGLLCSPLRLNTVQRLWRTPPTPPNRTMATSSKIHLSPDQKPTFYVPGITAETADSASELLQENHEKHHIFFNYAGFHVSPSLVLQCGHVVYFTIEPYRAPPFHPLCPQCNPCRA